MLHYSFVVTPVLSAVFTLLMRHTKYMRIIKKQRQESQFAGAKPVKNVSLKI